MDLNNMKTDEKTIAPDRYATICDAVRRALGNVERIRLNLEHLSFEEKVRLGIDTHARKCYEKLADLAESLESLRLRMRQFNI